jgi:hypothetical protein
MARGDLILAARTLEELFNVPPQLELRKMTKREKDEQDQRVRSFLALSVPLQEGCLRYARNILDAYKGEG